MKTELHYDTSSNTIYQKLRGLCSIQNLAEVFNEMEEYDLSPNLNILTDISDADLKDTNYNSVSYLEKNLDKFLDNYLPVHNAIIAESDLEFGIARMYEMLAEKDGFNVKVFRNKSDAEQWLKQQELFT